MQNSAGFPNMGFEKAKLTSNGEQFISASIQTLLNRKEKFNSNYFDTIILDEAHRYGASEWKNAVEYFNPQRLLGFTATPNRSDGKGLDTLFDDIIFERDIEFGIRENYLAPLECHRIDIGYDLSKVATRMGDFAVGELEQAVNIQSANEALKKVFDEFPKPALIYCVNVEHAEAVAAVLGIPSISQKTKQRSQILSEFREGKHAGIASINVLTEGVNLNNAKTLIMARPTQSTLLYIQIVGRILRLHPDKEKAYLVDCVGTTGEHELCGAPTLLGLDIEEVPQSERPELIGDLLDELPALIKEKAEDPRTYIKNRRIVKLFAKKHKLKLYGINFIKHPDGSLAVGVGNNKWIGISKIDHLGRSRVISYSGKEYPLKQAQKSIEDVVAILNSLCRDEKTIWDVRAVTRWGKAPASDAQIRYAENLLREKNMNFNVRTLNKQELSTIISRLKWNT